MRHDELNLAVVVKEEYRLLQKPELLLLSYNSQWARGKAWIPSRQSKRPNLSPILPLPYALAHAGAPLIRPQKFSAISCARFSLTTLTAR